MTEIKDENVIKRQYSQEILDIIRNPELSKKSIKDQLSDYHDSDIADVLEELSVSERKNLYQILGTERVSDVFSYLDDASEFLQELSKDKVVDIIENMDADDAVDVLEDLDENKKQRIIELLEDDAKNDIRMINSYDEDLIGSRMTTNFVTVPFSSSVKNAMREVMKQAEENDNISTVYVCSEEGGYFGAIELRDLVIARAQTPLDDIIIKSYPYLYATEKIEDCIERLKDYGEDSIPVLDEDKRIIGVITSTDITEAVTGELNEDYAKLAGLTEAEDLDEPLKKSIRKRSPWLIALLLLDLLVSSVTGIFEKVIDLLPFIVCFQSLILGMSGNVGTQSLAVTIRVLMEDDLTFGDKIKFVWKEIKIGLVNGLLLGIFGVAVITCYLYFTKSDFSLLKSIAVSSCIGASLLLSMLFASLSGTVMPMLFKKINVDPAAASGPLITTINDMVGVITYYGLSWLFLINLLKLF